jgi:hypothetical protein
MTLTEMKNTAQETLADFIKTMPYVPFTASDIVIQFANGKDMAKQAHALATLYAPDMTFTKTGN